MLHMTVTNTKNSDNVNHPAHYLARDIHIKCDCEAIKDVECIDITRHFNFNLGNAIKYIWRSEFKGNLIEDLKKAAWYLEDELKRLDELGKVEPLEHIERWCYICQLMVVDVDAHNIWHQKHGKIRPLQLEGCNYCYLGGVDESHVIACAFNPANKL